ncbi:MAG: septal ring lytic transglycosylase RlpA family protein [Solirubrobacteraceae bacterium]
MISRKLIAPIAGAMVVPCVAGLAVVGTAAGKTSTALEAATPVFGDAVLASRLLRANVLVDHRATIAGALAPTLASEAVTLEERVRHGWAAVAAAGPVAAGTFDLTFRPRRLGSDALRLQISGPDGTYETPAATLTVYHEVLVSWYGPGGLTACGEELTASTLGVASRTLPCGTRVTLRYRGRSVRVPVIDRGPYVAGRTYDLTYATKVALGAGDLTDVWANH